MNDTTTTTGDVTPAPALPTAANLRSFAIDTGVPVGARGTIPESVKAAFLKAGKRTQKRYL